MERADLIMVIGAMMIFSVLLLNVNRYTVHNEKVNTDIEIEYTALSLAQNLIDEARWKSFSSISDYNNVSTVDSTKVGVYQVDSTVNYVTPDDTEVNSGSATNYKRLSVTVSSNLMAHSVTLSYVKSK